MQSEKQSHHPFNFLIEAGNKSGTVRRALVNARDSTQALRIFFNRIGKHYFGDALTHARIKAIYKNTKKQVIIKKDCK